MIRVLTGLAMFSGTCGPGLSSVPLPETVFSLATGDEVVLTAEAPSTRLRVTIEPGPAAREGCDYNNHSALDLIVESYDQDVVSVQLNDCADQVWRSATELYGARPLEDPVRTFALMPFEHCPGGLPCATDLCADVELVDGGEVVLSGALRMCTFDVSAEVTTEDIPAKEAG